MSGQFKILRIEIDGHFHGSSDVPKPWVAQIDGVDAKYGLARTFVQRLNDYKDARRAWSGNKYGVVAAFPLHDGRLYEVSRLRGRSSKRHVAREFISVERGKLIQLEPSSVLARVDQHDGAAIDYTVTDGTSIARIDGIGSPAPCGFILVGGLRSSRLYRLRVGSIHEIVSETERYLVIADGSRPTKISQGDAISYLAGRHV